MHLQEWGRGEPVIALDPLALDPAFGPEGTWTRLRSLGVPASFLWCGRDALIPADHGSFVAEALPQGRQLELACSGHFVHGPHYRCFNRAVADAVEAALAARDRLEPVQTGAPFHCACVADADDAEEAARAPGFADAAS